MRAASRSAARLAWLLLLVVGLATPARPQLPHVPTGDVPAGNAAIRGRVVHAVHAEGVGDTDVVLYSRTGLGDEGIRVSRSDAQGFFAFERISNEPSTVYLVGARYEGIPFGAQRVLFAAGEMQREVTVRVTARTLDASAVEVREVQLRVERFGGDLVLRETYRLTNTGDETIYAPPAERVGVAPALRAALPDGARDFAPDFAGLRDGLVRDGPTVSFFGPLYPGEHELSFVYRLPAAGDALTILKVFPVAVKRIVVLHPESGLRVAAPGLVSGEAVTLDGRPFASLAARDLAPGTRLSLRVDLPPAQHDLSALSISHVRGFLDLDVALLRVHEEVHVQVAGDQPLVADGEAPLLHLEIPPGASDLRFSEETLAMGIRPANGGLAFYGPIPPGESALHVAYKQPVLGDSVEWTRRFAFEVPVLALLIADTGVVLESERLHRRRTIRTPDLPQLVAEAFHVAANERISLRLSPLRARPTLSRGITLSLALAGALGAALFLFAPLRRAPTAVSLAGESAATALEREREALYASIRDVDHDHEVGKLSDDDHRALREPLRARAIELLRAERDARGEAAESGADAPTPTDVGARACAACGAERRQADHFCARCGAPLARAPDRGVVA